MQNSFTQWRRKIILGGLAGAAIATVLAIDAEAVRAQPAEGKPISVIIGSPPGGIDTLVRMMTDSLTAKLGQPVVILNRPGANGLIAVDAVRRAEPDGNTVLFATVSTMVMNPMVYSNATYHAVNDFEPIAHHAFMPMVWIANKDSGPRDLQELVARAKENPGKINLSNHGSGGMAAVFETMFAQQFDIDVVQIPHAGASQSILRLMAGDVQVGLETLSVILPRIRSGDVVPLAVTSSDRVQALPTVPSWIEAGMPSHYGTAAWYGFFAPKGTPKATVDRLNDAINQTLKEPRIKSHMEGLGGTFEYFSAEQFRDHVSKDIERYAKMMQAAGITPQ